MAMWSASTVKQEDLEELAIYGELPWLTEAEELLTLDFGKAENDRWASARC